MCVKQPLMIIMFAACHCPSDPVRRTTDHHLAGFMGTPRLPYQHDVSICVCTHYAMPGCYTDEGSSQSRRASPPRRTPVSPLGHIGLLPAYRSGALHHYFPDRSRPGVGNVLGSVGR